MAGANLAAYPGAELNARSAHPLRSLRSYLQTRLAYQDHETAKAELKKLVPEDAKVAIGHGIRAKRTKAGAISFDPLQTESANAPVK